MDRILVAYATRSGSTSEVAQAIVEEIRKSGAEADLAALTEVKDLAPFSAIVLGAPMILGWHRSAKSFLRKNRSFLKNVPLAVFITCMSLTGPVEPEIKGIPLFVDGNLPKPPKRPGRLSFKERYSLPGNYLRPVIQNAPGKLRSVGIFGGKLNLSNMKWWEMIFIALILQAPASDKRNWEAIRGWASGLPKMLKPE